MHEQHSPQALLELVQSEYGTQWLESQTTVLDPTMHALIEAERDRLGVEAKVTSNVGLGQVVARLSEDLTNVLPPSDRKRLNQLVAFGGIDAPTVNARCVKSPAGVFAIGINFGLMLFLNRLAKLMAAGHDPTVVVYCNRGEPRLLTSQDYFGYADEVISYYRATGVVLGPRLRLNESGQHTSVSTLTLAEAFVVAHEIGHFLCGHLEGDDLFARDPMLPDFMVFEENEHHRAEFEADARGFELLHRFITARSMLSPQSPLGPALLGPLTFVFEALSFIGSSRTRSHPAPRDRLLAVIERFYEEGSVERFRAWVSDPRTNMPNLELALS